FVSISAECLLGPCKMIVQRTVEFSKRLLLPLLPGFLTQHIHFKLIFDLSGNGLSPPLKHKADNRGYNGTTKDRRQNNFKNLIHEVEFMNRSTFGISFSWPVAVHEEIIIWTLYPTVDSFSSLRILRSLRATSILSVLYFSQSKRSRNSSPARKPLLKSSVFSASCIKKFSQLLGLQSTLCMLCLL